MRLVLSDGDGLNAASCDRLLARLAEPAAERAAELSIDLSRAAFLDPYGAAVLVLIARHLQQRGQRLICVLPDAERPRKATLDLGLISALRPLAELRNTARPADWQSGVSALPVSPVASRNHVQEILAYLVALARQRLGYDTADVLDATKVVSELSHNVVDHSGAQGLAVAQLYRDRQGRSFISLAVVDAGIGIKASLARRHPEAATWRDGQAIQRALGGMTSREQGGGAGLRSVHAVVRRYQGRLSIRSGTDRVYATADRQTRISSGIAFPGVQVSISFSQRS